MIGSNPGYLLNYFLLFIDQGELSNILGSYRCICNRGYKPDVSTLSTKCVDVNECLQRPGPCEHECTNSWGSYACSCPQVRPSIYLFKSFQEMPKVCSIIWKWSGHGNFPQSPLYGRVPKKYDIYRNNNKKKPGYFGKIETVGTKIFFLWSKFFLFLD